MASLTAHPYLPAFRVRRGARASERTRPALARAERALLTARDVHTRMRVVATDRAVYHQDLANGLRSWHRMGWEQVERAEWDAVRGELRLVSQVPQVPDLAVRLPGPGRLLALARERVTATTLARVPLRHGGRIAGWVSARRAATGDGGVTWVVRLADGAQVPDTEVADAIRLVRVHTGLS